MSHLLFHASFALPCASGASSLCKNVVHYFQVVNFQSNMSFTFIFVKLCFTLDIKNQMNDANYGNYSTSLLSKYLVSLLSGNISYLCSEEIFQCLQVRLNTKFRPPVVWSKIFRNFGRAELAIKVKPKNSVVKVKPAGKSNATRR